MLSGSPLDWNASIAGIVREGKSEGSTGRPNDQVGSNPSNTVAPVQAVLGEFFGQERIYADGYSDRRWNAVSIGMSKQDVLRILGQPIEFVGTEDPWRYRGLLAVQLVGPQWVRELSPARDRVSPRTRCQKSG